MHHNVKHSSSRRPRVPLWNKKKNGSTKYSRELQKVGNIQFNISIRSEQHAIVSQRHYKIRATIILSQCKTIPHVAVQSHSRFRLTPVRCASPVAPAVVVPCLHGQLVSRRCLSVQTVVVGQDRDLTCLSVQTQTETRQRIC